MSSYPLAREHPDIPLSRWAHPPLGKPTSDPGDVRSPNSYTSSYCSLPRLQQGETEVIADPRQNFRSSRFFEAGSLDTQQETKLQGLRLKDTIF